ncbi:HAMP domain-containing histidine kinase [Thermosulfurimonas marina]|uniref:histidine kinase n=1 Tax=Thermosulfurimonas marina TaxID=2047767 RepID=A0A6H1WSX3_9BACT|nr:HAMP domain-containing sensor histidine kinase [Thermosulfurimonas marina]QJA06271.1 HAMP domain-containing histidine kinase [Thermosulfurimonas marina]
MRPKSLFRSLAFRLATLYALLFLGSLVGLFGAVHLILSQRLLQNQDQDLQEDLREIFTLYERKGLPGLKDLAAAEAREKGPGHYFFRLRDARKRVIFIEGSSWFSRLPWPEKTPAVPTFYLFRAPSGVKIRGVVFQLGPYRAEMAVSLRFEGRTLREVHRAFLWSGGLALLLTLPLGFWLSRRSLRPIREMERVSREIMESRDFSRRVPLSGRGDEADRLAETFNLLLSRLEIYFRELLQIFDNLAHDFKNLLAHVRLLAERALEREGSEREELLVNILYESDRFLHLLDLLLDLSEAETGLLRLRWERFPLKDLLAEIRQVFEPLAAEKNLQFEVCLPEKELVILGDRARLLQALFNLVDNAFKYTPSGRRVRVEATEKDRMVRIKVEDAGPGLSPEEIPRIFDRFYTGRKGPKGRGLGLALVRAYIEAHGGEIRVESEPGRGSVFYIVLPQTSPVETTHPAKEIVQD